MMHFFPNDIFFFYILLLMIIGWQANVERCNRGSTGPPAVAQGMNRSMLRASAPLSVCVCVPVVMEISSALYFCL